MLKPSPYWHDQKFISTQSSNNFQMAAFSSGQKKPVLWVKLGSALAQILSRLLDGVSLPSTAQGRSSLLFPDNFNSWQSLKILEGWRARSYVDVGGVWTIGWGRTHDVKPHQTTTQEAETEWLEQEIGIIADHLKKLIKVRLTQGQFDALILWAYNVGREAVERSTLIKLLNKGMYDEVPAQLMRWVYVQGRWVEGLENRRKAEIAIWKRA